jgi:hypothetical protein
MGGYIAPDVLHGRLARWVDAGLIDNDQATRIEAAEAAAAGPTRAAVGGVLAGRAPLVVEALGYLGGTLAIIAGFVAVTELWPDVPTGAQLSFAAAAAVVLGAVAALIRSGDPALGRLRSVLWAMSVGAVAAFTGILAGQVWEFGPLSTVLLAAAVAAAYAAGLWWRSPTSVQLLIFFVAAAVTVGTGIARVDLDLEVWAPGLGVWVFSVVWALATHRGCLWPAAAGYLAAAIGMLVGAQLTMAEAAGHVLALATVAALLVGGVVMRKVWLLAIGAIGVIQVVPNTATRYLPESVGAPLAILAVGLVLLGAALWLARARHPRPPATRR